MGKRMTIEPHAFKQIMAQWASGVTVVTTMRDGVPLGMTVSSFASVSLHPSRVLICASRTCSTHEGLKQSGYFAVHLLKQEQLAWGRRFAGLAPEVDDRFQGIDWRTARTGAPILPGALGWVDCYVVQAIISGDHTIFVGEVADGDMCDAAEPLLYHNRQWCCLAQEALRADA